MVQIHSPRPLSHELFGFSLQCELRCEPAAQAFACDLEVRLGRDPSTTDFVIADAKAKVGRLTGGRPVVASRLTRRLQPAARV